MNWKNMYAGIKCFEIVVLMSSEEKAASADQVVWSRREFPAGRTTKLQPTDATRRAANWYGSEQLFGGEPAPR